MRKSRFQQRFIAFVDVLGFGSIVKRMSNDDRLFTTVRDALKDVAQQSRDFQQYRREQRIKRKAILRKGIAPLTGDSNLQMTAFSDCYVISEVAPAWHVVAAVQALGIRFLEEGILTRGGVVHGKAYHNGRVLFGPGIVDAYTLESEVAKYPRIIVTESVRRAVRGYHEGLWKGQLLKRDTDGCWFVNLLVPSLSSWAPLSELAMERDLQSHLKKVRQSLAEAWERAQGNAGHMSKVWWLIHRFNKAAEAAGLNPISR
jgi:hypothetical protein